MIAVIVEFKEFEISASAMPRQKLEQNMLEAAPLYQAMEGLIRKYYLFTADGSTGVAVYLWESRAAAERVYNGEWLARNSAKFGKPTLTWYDCPMVVDNMSGEIITSNTT